LKGRRITRSVGLVWRKRGGSTTAYRQIAELIRDVVRTQFPELTIER
jgi:hypothetical protein